jgi:hypothetical protein
MDRYDHVDVNVNEGPFKVSVKSGSCFAVSNCGSNHNGPDWITKRVSRSYSLQSAECSSLTFDSSLHFVGPQQLEFS